MVSNSPSSNTGSALGNIERWPDMNRHALSLPAEEILNTAYQIPDANQGEKLLNDCLVLNTDNPNNPLRTYEGAMAMLQIVRGVDPNYPRLAEMEAAFKAHHKIEGYDPNITPDQIEAEMVNYTAILNYLKSVSEVVEEAKGELVDLDRVFHQGYSAVLGVRENWRAMSNGRQNLAAGIAIASIALLFMKKHDEGSIVGGFKKDLVAWSSRAMLIPALSVFLEATTGKGIIENVEGFNRRCGGSMADYFNMPYENREQRTRMNDVCELIGGEHNELLGRNVSFADLYFAWKSNDVSSIPRKGDFAGDTGATRLKEALDVIFEKFAPNRAGSVYGQDGYEDLTFRFDSLISPEEDRSPSEGIINLILADINAPRNLAPTLIDEGADIASDIGAIIVYEGGRFSRRHIEPHATSAWRTINEKYNAGRDWLDATATEARRRRASQIDNSADVFGGVPLNFQGNQEDESVYNNTMSLRFMPSDYVPGNNDDGVLEAGLDIQSGMIIRSQSGRKYFATSSNNILDALNGDMSFWVHNEEYPNGIKIDLDQGVIVYEEHSIALLPLPDSAPSNLEGISLENLNTQSDFDIGDVLEEAELQVLAR